MSLTKKQRKQIKDAAGSEDAATIAARLGLSSQEVGAFLRGLAKGGSRGQGADLTESRVGRVHGAALVLSPSPLALPLLAFLSWAALSALLANNTHEALTALS